MDALAYRSEDEMKDANWSPEQIKERIEDQEARPWLYK